MPPPPHRVAEVFRSGWKSYIATHKVASRLARVARQIMQCRTAALGGHLYQCDSCGSRLPMYNSCRDRHCPTCQTLRKQRWLEQRHAEVLPVPYFHVVFTLPHALNDLIHANRVLLLRELFSTVNWVLQRFGGDPQWKLCGQMGFIAVLHTWTQRLTAHYHLHCLVPGGAWNEKQGVWRTANRNFLFGRDALAKCFQARFLMRLQRLRQQKKLKFSGENLESLAEEAVWNEWVGRLWQVKWVVYPKATADSRDQALDYLGRYTHRVAVSDHRIVKVQDGQVTFSWRDRADHNQCKTMVLPAEQFIGRFLLHVLPRGFQKVRAFGWLSPKRKRIVLAAIRTQLRAEEPPPAPTDASSAERILRLTGVDVSQCPHCAKGRLAYLGQLPPSQAGPA